MGQSIRVKKVEKEINMIVSQFIATKLRDLTKVILSVGFVRATADLRQAKVYVNGINGEPDIELLQSYAVQIQAEIAKKIRMKFCPKIIFYKDDTSEKVLDLENKLNQIKQQS